MPSCTVVQCELLSLPGQLTRVLASLVLPCPCCVLRRCHTWTGRLHEDAFEDDLLDQLLSIHMRPEQQQLLSTAAAAAAATPTPDSVWQQLQQQQQQQSPSGYGTGAAAAAVEAAVAAINALLSGTASTPWPPPPPAVFSRQPLNDTAAGPQGVSSSPPQAGAGGQGSSASFYRALMATGGVLRPPGGPPIPLNVDYATEIQPHLGRLLGRGGFGAVYEGTWRGQRVRQLGLAPACGHRRVKRGCCVVGGPSAFQHASSQWRMWGFCLQL